jgi:hypothetical protein
MNIFTKIAFILSLTLAFSLNNLAFAEGSANIGEIISHIDKAIAEISKSDFSAAQVQLKAARTTQDRNPIDSEVAKKAHAFLLQGQIAARAGDVNKSTAELNKAIELYKTL